MKNFFRVFTILIAVLFFKTTTAQIVDPVKWNFIKNKAGDCELQLIFKAKIDGNWHMYGQKSYGDDGPVPTSFHFTKNANYELVGKLSEKTLIKKFEPVWGFDVYYFEHEATFTQKILIKSDKPFDITGDLEFMVCAESCLPPTTVNFKFHIDKDELCSKSSTTSSNTSITPLMETCDCDTNAIVKAFNAKSFAPDTTKKTMISEGKPIISKNEKNSGTRAWWAIFITGFIGGLFALLTPCVFPMIPLTVSFFTKRSKTRAIGISNAFKYGLAIIAIYVSLGLGVTLIFGPDALNALSTNVWFNLFFFFMLVVFGISFLGAFEIVIPSSLVNKVDAKSDKGGLIGIFFMASTLSLVSFSCTGPIIGTLLVDAAVNGGIRGPFLGMLGFSTALALPFGLFAAFPGWLNSLPKSGGWLNSVKVVLGFLELALALKFASNADLVVQAGIITREVFITIWIVIFALTGIYLMGWIKLSHDSDIKHLSVTRLLFAILSFSFTVYLIPGLWGAPLKIISGFPPPDFYSESPMGFRQTNPMITNLDDTSKTHKKEHCPNNLPCFHDYNEALAYARKINKPLMIDFTGWACVNCRKMEAQVWTDAEVDKRLRNEIVLVSLYVDDKTELPIGEQRVAKIGDRDFTIKTIGNKWSYFQANTYKTNAQPQYVLVDNNEQMLTTETAHYDSDIKKYIDWLDEGINEFEKRTKK